MSRAEFYADTDEKLGLRRAGIDEAGRGCLAGPVIAAAVILDPHRPIPGLKDSKCLSPTQRSRLAALIRDQALAWALGRAEASEIDRLNILQASLLAMQRAYQNLPLRPDYVIVDGRFYPPIACPGTAMIRADRQIPEVAAASILAKVYRDEELALWDRCFPEYHFTAHKSYPTRGHLEILATHGVLPLYRQSFAPIQRLKVDVFADPHR